MVDDLNILTDLIRIGSDFRHTLTGLRDLGQCELEDVYKRQVYGVINSAIQKIGIQNFQIYKYTITGKLSLLPMNPSGNECLTAFGVAIVFIVMMISVSSVVFQKRDI